MKSLPQRPLFLAKAHPHPRVTVHLFILGVLLHCALCSPAFAQVPAYLQGKPILDVEIQGEAKGLLSAKSLGIEKGNFLSRRYLRSLVQQLVDSNRWSNIQIDAVPKGTGVLLRIILKSKQQIGNIRIVGNQQVSLKELRDRIQLDIGQEIVNNNLTQIQKKIIQAYQAKGFNSTTAKVRLRDTSDPSKKIIWISVDEGQQDILNQVEFLGDSLPAKYRFFLLGDLQKKAAVTSSFLNEEISNLAARLREKGFLEALAKLHHVERNGHLLSVQIQLRLGPQYEVHFSGKRMIHPRILERVMLLTEERLTKARLAFFRRNIEDLYAKYGFSDTDVSFEIKQRNDQKADLLVHVKPGNRKEVTQISFQGNQFFESSFLEEQIESFLNEELSSVTTSNAVRSDTIERIIGNDDFIRPVRVKMIQPLPPKRVYYKPAFERALKHIQQAYEVEGFLQTKIGSPQIQQTAQSNQKIRLVVPVEEGPRSSIFSVEILGENVLGQKQVLEAAELKQGEPFNYSKLEKARRHIVDLYKEQGFAFAIVNSETDFSGDQTRVRISFSIFPRFKVQISEIRIQGAERTKLSLIRDLIPIEIGDVYRPSVVRKIQERLSALGIFNSVSISLQSPEIAARLKPLVVTVSERPNQWIDFSAGVSTEQGIRSGFEYGYRNLFGYAIRFNFRTQLAYQFFFLDQDFENRLNQLSLLDRLERQINLSLTIPHLPSVPDVISGLNLVHQRDNERSFGLDKIGAGLSFTWKPMRWFSLLFSEDFEFNNVDLFVGNSLEELIQITEDARLLRLLRVPEGRTMVAASSATAIFDFRDNLFTPTEGFYASVFSEWTHSLFEQENDSDFFSNHIKVSATFSGYIPFLNRFVLALQTKTGGVIHLQERSQTYPNRLFFLGGVDSLRGFREDTLIPQDLADEITRNPNLGPKDVVPGADAFFLLRAELRAHIKGSFYAGVFGDFGNLWAEGTKYNPLDLRPTAGLGLRFATPVGPIALDYGFVLLRRKSLNEPFGNFHFSIGLF